MDSAETSGVNADFTLGPMTELIKLEVRRKRASSRGMQTADIHS